MSDDWRRDVFPKNLLADPTPKSSLRLRLLQSLMERNLQKQVSGGHPLLMMPRLTAMARSPNPLLDSSVPYAQALRGLRSPVFLKREKYQEQQMRANRDGAWQDVIDFERAFIRKLATLNIPAFAHNMVRTPEEQDALFVRGVSRSRGGKSPHNHGLAVDIVHSIYGWELSAQQWEIFGHLGKEVAHTQGVRIEWGGDWSDPDGDGIGWDPAHWEIANWKERVR